MHIHSGNKHAPEFDREVTVPTSDFTDDGDEAYQQEIAAMLGDESIDLDDALDDDNENPVGHTLVDAAENSGAGEIRDMQELEGEEQESKDRTGNMSPLYKES